MTQRGWKQSGVGAASALLLACAGPVEHDLFDTPPDGASIGPATSGESTGAESSAGGGQGSSQAVSGTMTGTEAGPTTVTSTTSNTSAASTGSNGMGGAGSTPCSELTEWETGNFEQMFPRGTEFSYQGRRYRANEDITYTNSECEPNAPAEWCASWFVDQGPC